MHRAAFIEGLITAAEISGHLMYQGEGTQPNTLTHFLTVNGPSMGRNLAQRCVFIQLGKPNHAPTWEEETNSFIDANRDRLMADVAAFFARAPVTLEKCSRWGAWERSVLARLADPAEAAAVILERQAEVDADESEGADVEDYFGRQLELLGYDSAGENVHIPNDVARGWYIKATGAMVTTTAVTRAVKQGSTEGLLKRLRINPGRTYGRGLLWFVEGGRAIACDIEQRIVDQRDQQRQAAGHF